MKDFKQHITAWQIGVIHILITLISPLLLRQNFRLFYLSPIYEFLTMDGLLELTEVASRAADAFVTTYYKVCVLC